MSYIVLAGTYRQVLKPAKESQIASIQKKKKAADSQWKEKLASNELQRVGAEVAEFNEQHVERSVELRGEM